MAVAHDASASAKATAASSVSVSVTVANNTNRLLLGFFGFADDTQPTVSSFVFNTSENLTSIWNTTAGSNYRWGGYRLLAPTATTANLAVTFSTTVNEMAVGGVSLYNVDQGTPLGTHQTRDISGAGNDASVSFAGTANGLGVGMLYRDTSSSSPTVAISDFPKYVTNGTLSTGTSTSITASNAPGQRNVGDLEICVCHVENANTHSWSGTGWTKGEEVTTTGFCCSWGWRVYDGSNSNPTISWSGSNDCQAQRFLYSNVLQSGTPCQAHGTKGSGTGTTHTSTGGSPAASSTVLYIDACAANTAVGTPTNYTEDFDAGSATGPIRFALGHREGAGGNISVTGGNAAWGQMQIELLTDAQTETQRTEQENIGGFGVFSIASEPALTTNNGIAWLATGGTSARRMTGGVCALPAAAAGTARSFATMF